jgi:hypothetical protein
VLAAMKKDRLKPLQMLSNFITGWDFSRFAYLVDRMYSKDTLMPKLSEVKDILTKCREARNHKSHYDGNPDTEPLPDAELLNLLHCTRNCLPSINSQNTSQPGDSKLIYKRLNVLESLLFHKEKDVNSF